MFHIRQLHIGHLAKAFALREAPGDIAHNHANPSNKRKQLSGNARIKINSSSSRDRASGVKTDENTERRMQEVVRRQGRLSKHDGKMMISGTSEFQIAAGDELDKLISQR